MLTCLVVLLCTDQQQQLNEQYAKEQEQAMNLPVHRRRRSSADTHRHNRLNDPFKHPSSYHHNPGGKKEDLNTETGWYYYF